MQAVAGQSRQCLVQTREAQQVTLIQPLPLRVSVAVDGVSSAKTRCVERMTIPRRTWARTDVSCRERQVDRVPVGCDGSLRIVQCHRAAADLVVEVVLDPVLLMRARSRLIWLGPEICDVIRAAELQGYEMVD